LAPSTSTEVNFASPNTFTVTTGLPPFISSCASRAVPALFFSAFSIAAASVIRHAFTDSE
jgi:hypothetical protein